MGRDKKFRVDRFAFISHLPTIMEEEPVKNRVSTNPSGLRTALSKKDEAFFKAHAAKMQNTQKKSSKLYK